jgi:hypothetical protein
MRSLKQKGGVEQGGEFPMLIAGRADSINML